MAKKVMSQKGRTRDQYFRKILKRLRKRGLVWFRCKDQTVTHQVVKQSIVAFKSESTFRVYQFVNGRTASLLWLDDSEQSIIYHKELTPLNQTASDLFFAIEIPEPA